MPVRTEITVRLANSPGALHRVCEALAAERVSIDALALETGRLRLIVDNHVRALGTLRGLYQQVDVREVITARAPNAPGALAPILALVAAAGVNVEYAYGGAGEGAASALLVLGVDDPLRAATLAGV